MAGPEFIDFTKYVGRPYLGLNSFLNVNERTNFTIGEKIHPTIDAGRLSDPVEYEVGSVDLTAGSPVISACISNISALGATTVLENQEQIYTSLSFRACSAVTFKPQVLLVNSVAPSVYAMLYNQFNAAAELNIWVLDKTVLPIYVPPGFYLSFSALGLAGSENIEFRYARVIRQAGVGPLYFV